MSNWFRRALNLPDLPAPVPVEVKTQPIVVNPQDLAKLEHAEWRVGAISQYVRNAPLISDKKKLEFRTECRELTSMLIKAERMTEDEAETLMKELR